MGAALAVLGATTGAPVVLLLGLVAAMAGAGRRWLAYDAAVVASVALLLLSGVLAGLLASVLSVDLLARPVLVQGTLVVLAAAAAASTRRRAGGPAPSASSTAERWSWAPAWAAVLLGLLQVGRDGLAASWALGSSDPAQHVLFLGGIQRSGVLDYGAEAYPRGLHVLLALVAAPDARPAGTAAQLVGDLQLYAGATWLSAAVVLCAAAGVTHRLGAVLGASRRAGAVAAWLVGVPLLLSDASVGTYVYMGAAPALLAIAVLWLPVLVLLGRRQVSAPCAVVGAAASVALLAHLWQALVLVPVVAGLALALSGRVRLLEGLRPWGSLRAWALSSVLCTGLAVIAAVPVLGVQSRGGVSLAAIPGELTPVPWVLLGVSCALAVGLVRERRDAGVRLLMGTGVGLVVVTAVLVLGAGQGLDLTQYYPTKALWYLTVLLSPVAALAVVRHAPWACRAFLALTGRAGGAARLVRFTAVTVPVVLVAAWFGPTWFGFPLVTASVVQPPSSAPVARTLAIALDAAERDDVVVVPVGVVGGKVFTRSGGYVVSKLLSFQTGQTVTYGLPDRVCAEVEKAAGGRPALVVTDLDARLLARLADAQGCGVPVEQLTGAPAASVAYQDDVLRAAVEAAD